MVTFYNYPKKQWASANHQSSSFAALRLRTDQFEPPTNGEFYMGADYQQYTTSERTPATSWGSM